MIKLFKINMDLVLGLILSKPHKNFKKNFKFLKFQYQEDQAKDYHILKEMILKSKK